MVGASEAAAAGSLVVRVPRVHSGVIVLVRQWQGAPLRAHSCRGRVEHDHGGWWAQV